MPRQATNRDCPPSGPLISTANVSQRQHQKRKRGEQTLDNTEAVNPFKLPKTIHDLVGLVKTHLGEREAVQLAHSLHSTTASTGPPIGISTGFKSVQEVCLAFELDHFEARNNTISGTTTAPLVAWANQDAYSWHVTDLDLYAVLDQALPNVSEQIRPLGDNADYIDRWLYCYNTFVERTTEAACRPCVDLILLEAVAIISGVKQEYDKYYTPGKVEEGSHHHHSRHQTPNPFRRAKLHFELPVKHKVGRTGLQYIGKVDWGIGISFNKLGAVAAPEYISLLTVVEAKHPVAFGKAEVQILAYMACVYHHRKDAKKRKDASTYGIATDGYCWVFYMIDNKGTVKRTREYRIVPGGKQDLKLVVAQIIYILIKSQELVTPQNTPDKKDKEGDATRGDGFQPVVCELDDSEVLRPADIDPDDYLEVGPETAFEFLDYRYQHGSESEQGSVEEAQPDGNRDDNSE